MSSFSESAIEEAAFAWLGELGYGIKAGSEDRSETIVLEALPNHFLLHFDRMAYIEALNASVAANTAAATEAGAVA